MRRPLLASGLSRRLEHHFVTAGPQCPSSRLPSAQRDSGRFVANTTQAKYAETRALVGARRNDRCLSRTENLRHHRSVEKELVVCGSPKGKVAPLAVAQQPLLTDEEPLRDFTRCHPVAHRVVPG